MRKLFGIGTPKSLQKEADLAAPAYLLMLMTWCIVRAYRRVLTATSASAAHHGLRWPALAPLL